MFMLWMQIYKSLHRKSAFKKILFILLNFFIDIKINLYIFF